MILKSSLFHCLPVFNRLICWILCTCCSDARSFVLFDLRITLKSQHLVYFKARLSSSNSAMRIIVGLKCSDVSGAMVTVFGRFSVVVVVCFYSSRGA